jgi:hypothetical protein
VACISVPLSPYPVLRLASSILKAVMVILASRSSNERSDLRARPSRVVRSVKVAPRMSTSEADAVSSHEMYAARACRGRRLRACCHLSLTYRTTDMCDVLERHGWPAGDRSKQPCTPLFLGEQPALRLKLALSFGLSCSRGPLACLHRPRLLFLISPFNRSPFP